MYKSRPAVGERTAGECGGKRHAGSGREVFRFDGERIQTVVDDGRFAATADFDRLGEPDALLICVPTPLDHHRQPNLAYVEKLEADLAAAREEAASGR